MFWFCGGIYQICNTGDLSSKRDDISRSTGFECGEVGDAGVRMSIGRHNGVPGQEVFSQDNCSPDSSNIGMVGLGSLLYE